MSFIRKLSSSYNIETIALENPIETENPSVKEIVFGLAVSYYDNHNKAFEFKINKTSLTF
jgi:hypothetical protein